MIYFLGFIAFLTSAVSGVTGMGGGVLLLSFMTFFLKYQILIPIHGIIQLLSNGSRAMLLRKNVKQSFLIPFAIGAPIGSFIAYFVLSAIAKPTYFYLILAVFILYTVFKPKKIPHFKLQGYQWTLLGIASGTIAPILGATGPLIAPFYVRDDINKEEVVATKAAQQVITHALKIPLFISLSFDYSKHLTLILTMSVGTILGTFAGVKILKSIPAHVFTILFKAMLLIAAGRLIYKYGVTL